MKIYRVLKDLKPFLTEGTVKESNLKLNFTEDGIKELRFKKYIEVPKPEFTADDMKQFAKDWVNIDNNTNLNEYFDEWKSQN